MLSQDEANKPKTKHVLKKFSHAQIREKIASRAYIEDYEECLMKCSVTQDESGITFDTNCDAWRFLVKKVEVAEKKRNEEHDITASDTKRTPVKTNNETSNAPRNRTNSTYVHVMPSPEKLEQKLKVDPEKKEKARIKFASEIALDNPDPVVIRFCCKLIGVDPNHRGKIWQSLLKTTRYNGKRIIPNRITFDLPNQRVIRADIDRTLPSNDKFRDPLIKHDLEVLLTFYCKNNHVTYKQGMNYILAPMFLIDLPDPSAIYALYQALISKFLPNTFTDEEFGGLQTLFAMFRLLLLYHDPELCVYLDRYDMGPELYASSWFITLFANRIDPDLLLPLWDVWLLEADQDPMLLYFFSLSLLISRREAIFAESEVQLPGMLSKLAPTSVEEIKVLMHLAKNKFRAQTFLTFRRHLRSVSRRRIEVDSAEYNALVNQPCLYVSAEELVEHCYIDLSGKKSNIRFFIIDCRTAAHYANGHLPCAFHLNPDLLLQPEKLNEVAASLKAMQSCHFCFLSEGWTVNPSASMFKLFFLQKGFRFISSCAGGFEACHIIIMSQDNDYELVDHNDELCLECSKVRGKFKFLSSVKKTMSGIVAAARDDVKTALNPRLSSIPITTCVHSQTNYIRMLHTVLFDLDISGMELSCAIRTLTSCLLSLIMDNMTLMEKPIPLSTGDDFIGVQPIVLTTISFCNIGEMTLGEVFRPFSSIANINAAKAKVHKGTDNILKTEIAFSAQENLLNGTVIIFQPILFPEDVDNVAACIEELLNMDVAMSRIVILTLVLARPAAWGLYEAFPDVMIVTSAIHDYAGNKVSKALSDLESRYFKA